MDNAKFIRALVSGFNSLYNNKSLIDELNIFPVPDGDTGTNMSLTCQSAKLAIEKSNLNSISSIAKETSGAMLRGARGNSGVILSLLFRGIYKGLKEVKEVDPHSFATALDLAAKEAYGAVMNPTEGTILTVAKDIAVVASKSTGTEFSDFFSIIVDEAEKSVLNTPNLLPVLKKAGVVDAGGKGLLVLLQGMKSVIVNNREIKMKDKVKVNKVLKSTALSNDNILYTYCTEFIVNTKGSKSELPLKAYLETIGDCVVVVADDDIIKIHVHTNNPGNAITEGLKYGFLSNIKIDNMKIQKDTKAIQAKKIKKNNAYVPVDPEVKASIVTVCNGEGVKNLFCELGADVTVDGGQTMNPSTEDILEAIHSVPGKTVFVLPNNKNIIMSSEQAGKLADRQVIVLQTKTIPQGMAGILAYDPDNSIKQNELLMTKASQKVKTGLVTFAARNSIYDGKQIGKNEILALENGRIVLTEKDVNKATYRLMKKLISSSDQFVTILYGREISKENSDLLYDQLKDKFGDQLEINLLDGGQSVYYYIISVE